MGPDGDDKNNIKPGGGLENVYFFVSLWKNKQTVFFGPGDLLFLSSGDKAVYLGTVTQKGLGPSLAVCREDRSDARLVALTDVHSVVALSTYLIFLSNTIEQKQHKSDRRRGM